MPHPRVVSSRSSDRPRLRAGTSCRQSSRSAIGQNGPDRTVYRAPVMFYWSGWSPDGRYVLIWEVDFFSGSVDMDGRPLIVIDARTGMRFDLGRTLLHGTTAWSPPHTLAFAAGFGREVSQEKTLRLWAPETGVRDVSPIGTAALAPVWSASGQSLYFVSGPAGEYGPLPFFTGHAIGDRRISVYDLASGTTRTLAHEPGYVEEGVRPSRDGSRLLVLRARHRARPHRERRLWVLRLVSRPERMGLVRVT